MLILYLVTSVLHLMTKLKRVSEMNFFNEIHKVPISIVQRKYHFIK
jgi:hypothetical protein